MLHQCTAHDHPKSNLVAEKAPGRTCPHPAAHLAPSPAPRFSCGAILITSSRGRGARSPRELVGPAARRDIASGPAPLTCSAQRPAQPTLFQQPADTPPFATTRMRAHRVNLTQAGPQPVSAREARRDAPAGAVIPSTAAPSSRNHERGHNMLS